MDINEVMISILAIVIILFIAFLIWRFFDNAKEKLEIQDCRNSIGAHALLAKVSQREIFTDIKCQTRELNIDAKNHENAKRVMAEDMRRCWYEWQKGNAQLFEGEGIFCHVCGVYSFKQKDQKIERFATFLLTENIKIRSVYPEDTQKMTYMQYFQGFTTEQIDEIEKFPKNGTFADSAIIDTSKKYATIFVYASGKDEIEEYLEGGGRSTALVAGGVSVALGATAIGAAFIVSNPVGWVVGGVLAVTAGVIAIYNALTPEEPQWMSIVQFMEYNSTEINELGCQYLAANQLSHQQP